MTTVDYLVVGSGLTGSTIARLLADDRREVLLLERRAHPGGNVHDFMHASGIRIHTYGPHYFRCSDREIWEFVNRFSSFYPHEPIVKLLVDNRYENWPLNRRLLGQNRDWRPSRRPGAPKNFEEACLQQMPRRVYEKYVEGYTRKQWGMDPRLLNAKLADRIRINEDHQTTLTPHYLHQGLPTLGYTALMANMIADIPCRFGVDYLKHRSEYRARKALIFSGSIDEFFGFEAGRLSYRGQQRRHQFLPDVDWHQPCVQVNHPDVREKAIRTLEWKHLMPLDQRPRGEGTVITKEYPFTPDQTDNFEYPVPIAANARLHRHYRLCAATVRNLIVCGRLGTYTYLNMDKAIGCAMQVAARLCEQRPPEPSQWSSLLAV